MAETTLLKAEERKDTGKSFARAVRKKVIFHVLFMVIRKILLLQVLIVLKH